MIASALVALLTATPESQLLEALVGVYREVSVKQSCELDIQQDGRFVLSCPHQPKVHGKVDLWGDALAFGTTLSPLPDTVQGYALEVTTGQLPLIPVQGPRWQFLVEPNGRDGFCAAATKGRHPKKSTSPKGLYRREKGGVLAGIPWQRFCDTTWSPRVDVPR